MKKLLLATALLLSGLIMAQPAGSVSVDVLIPGLGSGLRVFYQTDGPNSHHGARYTNFTGQTASGGVAFVTLSAQLGDTIHVGAYDCSGNYLSATTVTNQLHDTVSMVLQVTCYPNHCVTVTDIQDYGFARFLSLYNLVDSLGNGNTPPHTVAFDNGVTTVSVFDTVFIPSGASSYCYYQNFCGPTWTICDSLVSGGGVSNCNYSVNALPVAGMPNMAAFNFSGGNPGGASSFFWDFGDGNTSSQPTPFHTYTQPGTYYYCLTIDSCSPVCDSVTVYSQGGGCDPFFVPVVNGATVDIIPALLTGQFIAVVDWGDGQVDTYTPQNIPVLPANISHTYASPGNYAICFTHSNPSLGCSNTRCDSVVVGSANPSCQALWIVDSVNSINFAGNVVLWNLSTGGSPAAPLNYIWDWGDGTTSTGPYPMHSYADTGIYNICLTVNDPVSGCTDTFCDSLGFDANGNLIYKGTAFAGFTVMVVDPATVGQNELDFEANVDVYPVPSKGLINIESSTEVIWMVEVFDISGARIISREVDSGISQPAQITIDQQGIYLLRIHTESGLVTKRVLVD